jgi:hypothetical protein
MRLANRYSIEIEADSQASAGEIMRMIAQLQTGAGNAAAATAKTWIAEDSLTLDSISSEFPCMERFTISARSERL